MRPLPFVHPQYEAFEQTITLPIRLHRDGGKNLRISVQDEEGCSIPEEDIFIPFASPLAIRDAKSYRASKLRSSLFAFFLDSREKRKKKKKR